MKLTPRTARVMTIAALLMLLATAGCNKPADMRDQRLVDLAKESMARQAEQNEHIARQSHSIIEESQKLAEAAKELVTHDAKARQELVSAHDRLNAQLNEQRAGIDAGRDELERERRVIAQQRHRDPILAAAIQDVGLIIACTLPLIVCIFVIRRMSSREPDDAAVAELLVHELMSDKPHLLPGPSLRPPALEHQVNRDECSETSPSDQPAESDLRS